MTLADVLFVLKGFGAIAGIILLIKTINDVDERWQRRRRPDLGRVRPRRTL